MPRRSATNDLLFRNRWREWFRYTLSSLPAGGQAHNASGRLVSARLAKEIGQIADGRVSKWFRGVEAPIDAEVAYRVGATLSRLGAPRCFPAMAVLAAGRLDEFLRYLRVLSYAAPTEAVECFMLAPELAGLIDLNTAKDRGIAIRLRQGLIEAGAASITERMQTNTGRSSDIFLTPRAAFFEPDFYARFDSKDGKALSDAAWQSRHKPLKHRANLIVPNELIKVAIQLDKNLSRAGVGQELALQNIWRILLEWARQIDPVALLQYEKRVFMFVGDPLTEARFFDPIRADIESWESTGALQPVDAQ